MADTLRNGKLKIFDDGIIVDENLPKWKNAVTETKAKQGTYTAYTINNNGTSIGTTNDPWSEVFVTPNESWGPTGGDLDKIRLSEIATMGLRELTNFIKDNRISYYLKASGQYNNTINVLTYSDSSISDNKKMTFFQKVKALFSTPKEEKPEFDAIEFFTKIKATSKESAQGYVNRVEKYLTAIRNAKMVGQTALVEKLIREMIANKYESFLAAEGYYHVVSEEQMVDFIRKSERGISIDYIKNFVRPIPMNVIEKIAKASELEVFDNYVIVHYDPKGTNRQDTAKEEYKKRDPIVFGVIAGSTKLYYITDWIDDYCDLTLEKFVDTLKITKDDLVIDEQRKAEIEAEKKEKEAKKAKVVKEKEDEKPLTPKKKRAPKKKKTN